MSLSQEQVADLVNDIDREMAVAKHNSYAEGWQAGIRHGKQAASHALPDPESPEAKRMIAKTFETYSNFERRLNDHAERLDRMSHHAQRLDARIHDLERFAHAGEPPRAGSPLVIELSRIRDRLNALENLAQTWSLRIGSTPGISLDDG